MACCIILASTILVTFLKSCNGVQKITTNVYLERSAARNKYGSGKGQSHILKDGPDTYFLTPGNETAEFEIEGRIRHLTHRYRLKNLTNYYPPGGIYLQATDDFTAPFDSPDQFELSGCVGKAFLTFWNPAGKRTQVRKFVTEMMCHCKVFKYRKTGFIIQGKESEYNETNYPQLDISSVFKGVSYSYCVKSAALNNRTCDCSLPRGPLPWVGIGRDSNYTSLDQIPDPVWPDDVSVEEETTASETTTTRLPTTTLKARTEKPSRSIPHAFVAMWNFVSNFFRKLAF